MQKVLTAEEMREVDRLTTEKYGVPSLLLMENAAHAAARAIAKKLGGSVGGQRFQILCGKGNNGGDGAALARILWTLGAAQVHVMLIGGKVENTKGDARTNFEICRRLDRDAKNDKRLWFSEHESVSNELIETKWLDAADLYDGCHFVDALFGTGLRDGLDGEFREYVERIAAHRRRAAGRALYVSLDLPSGLGADAGTPIGAHVEADLTITFTAPKAANVVAPAAAFNGELVVADIGSPRELLDEAPSRLFVAEKSDVQNWLRATAFTNASYKNKRGHALLVAGSNNYAGAAILAANGTIVSGVGLATVATARSAQNSIASRVLPEVMTRGVAETEDGKAVAVEAFAELDEFIESSIDAVAVGSGLSSSHETTKRLVRELVERRRTPVVIDADGLTALLPFETKGSDELPLILTPHEGEFLKLLGTDDREAIKDRVAAARDFAQRHHVILVMKGERALVAAPDGRVVVNPTGNSGLGKAGNGDTLAGIIVGFVAQGAQMKVDIFETVVAAVYLAGFAGDLAAEKYGKRSMLASDVRECLTEAFRQVGEGI